MNLTVYIDNIFCGAIDASIEIKSHTLDSDSLEKLINNQNLPENTSIRFFYTVQKRAKELPLRII